MTCYCSTCLLFVLSLFVLNTFVFGVKRETTGCARQFLKMDIRGQSDQLIGLQVECTLLLPALTQLSAFGIKTVESLNAMLLLRDMKMR